MRNKARIEPYIAAQELDWSAYLERLSTILEQAGKETWRALYYLPKLYVTHNWGPVLREERDWFRNERGPSTFKRTDKRDIITEYKEEELIYDPEYGEEVAHYARLAVPTLPDGVEAFLTVALPVFDLKKWDIKRVMDRVKRLVREAIVDCPTPQEAPGMLLADSPRVLPVSKGSWTKFHIAISGMRSRDVGRILSEFKSALHRVLESRPDSSSDVKAIVPPEWRFLLHAQEAAFRRDIQRYLLYQLHGRSVRQIAYLEQHEKRGNRVKNLPRKIGRKVPNESGVWKSIARIYQAVHGKPLGARRRRLDTPAEGIPPYYCPLPGHKGGSACPENCSNWQAFRSVVGSTLPTDTTGKSRLEHAPPAPAIRHKKAIRPDY